MTYKKRQKPACLYLLLIIMNYIKFCTLSKILDYIFLLACLNEGTSSAINHLFYSQLVSLNTIITFAEFRSFSCKLTICIKL